jgi:hypothetical protein
MTADHRRWLPPAARSTHSFEEKRFLGVTIPEGIGPDESIRRALDVLANHPNVGPFIGKQLIQRLVSSNPSTSYVTRVATVFNNNGLGVRGDLGAVFKAILIDPEATDPATVKSPFSGRLREPMVRFVQWARTFDAKSTSGKWSIRDLSPDYLLKQAPFRSPSVFNFFRPEHVPARSQAMANNMVAPEFQIATDTTVASYVNFISGVLRNQSYWYEDIEPDYGPYIALADDPVKLLDTLELVLTGGQLSDFARQIILSALNSVPANSSSDPTVRLERVRQAIALIMSSNDYLIQK